jgi:hypothetical protein
LVTDEAFQPSANKHKRNWKIPAVCNMESVQTPWISFLTTSSDHKRFSGDDFSDWEWALYYDFY